MSILLNRSKKGIRCLAGDRMRCSSCPYSRPGNLNFLACVKDIARDTMQAITEQSDEINKLKKELKQTEGNVRVVERVIEVEKPPVMGKWYYDNQGHYFCSECGFMENEVVKLKIRKFCPVCGAKMEVERV